MRWSELVLLMEGISPRTARRRRYEPSIDAQEKKRNQRKILAKRLGCLAKLLQISGMDKRPTYAESLSKIAVLERAMSAKDATIARKEATIARKEERIAYLERLLFGGRSDRIAAKAAMANQPGSFDGLFNGAYDERAA